jgi:hypothetical protein
MDTLLQEQMVIYADVEVLFFVWNVGKSCNLFLLGRGFIG